MQALPVLSGEMTDLIPDPMEVRRLIGVRAAELSVLRKLLKLAESRDCIRTSTTANPILIPTTTQATTNASR